MTAITIEHARELVAKLAEADGEMQFAREVRAGCWDHRNDVQAALRGERLRGERKMVTLSDNDLYYLRCIKRRLGEFNDALADTAAFSLGGQAFADEIDWLDCFIDQHERACDTEINAASGSSSTSW